MKLIALALLAAAIGSSQTVTTISFTGVAPSVLLDFNTYWLDQSGPSIGTLTGALDASTTTVTITLDQSGLSSAQPMPKVGQSIILLATREPMLVTGVDGLTLTLKRGESPQSPLVAHSAGESIAILRYASGWAIVEEVLRAKMQEIAISLGVRSRTFGATVTGTIQ
jgi:hypothetical protein